MKKPNTPVKNTFMTDNEYKETLRDIGKMVKRFEFRDKVRDKSDEQRQRQRKGEPLTAPGKKGRVKPPWTSKSMNPFGKLLKRPD